VGALFEILTLVAGIGMAVTLGAARGTVRSASSTSANVTWDP
jgi:hypothetical protein